ncbi:protein GOLM2 isoform X2 [Dunckerocampus dactyliophorus]|uniref:protein GOLM2 isoform X2 n=1 Tax=Dunckerocampus dactyliophorus TaxID=161453 RepID=UPI002404C6F4|nr:protein GOLM2 isoform X2 [Dunckerocampus dactyliophorus]
MIGFGANRRGGRLPSFILIFLMAIIAILAFNYWTVSSKHGRLLDELAEVQSRVKRTDAARSRLEKRNSELMVQVDTHRKQMEQKDGDYAVLEGKLQARDALVKKCTEEKAKLQGDAAVQMKEIQRLKEQLNDLKQEFMKQEKELSEVKSNRTTSEKKLEYENLQCGRQIAQLKLEYEESKKTLEEAVKLRQHAVDHQNGVAAGRRAEGAPGVQLTEEHHTVATHRRDSLDLKDVMGKPGSDAGMPGIEDSEVGKLDEMQFELKKPAITQKKRDEAPDAFAGAGAGPGDGPGGQGLALDQPRLQQDGVEGQAAVIAPPGVVKLADKPMVFEEDNKADIKADELGEQQRQLRAPDVKGEDEHLKGIPLPGNPAQVPKPIQPHRAKDQVPAGARHRHQNDDDRDMQGDRAVDYGKRRQVMDVL